MVSYRIINQLPLTLWSRFCLAMFKMVSKPRLLSWSSLLYSSLLLDIHHQTNQSIRSLLVVTYWKPEIVPAAAVNVGWLVRAPRSGDRVTDSPSWDHSMNLSSIRQCTHHSMIVVFFLFQFTAIIHYPLLHSQWQPTRAEGCSPSPPSITGQ